MTSERVARREFLRAAAVAGAAAAAPTALAQETAPAQVPAAAPDTAPVYAFLNLEEQAFVEALVDHMIPADELTPKGTDLGVNVYIDRALGGAWGQGDRLYMQGPWRRGVPSQGYQLPLTPAQLYRAGIEATNARCVKTWGRPFDRLGEPQREEVLLALSAGKLDLGALPARAFWTVLYQTVMEGVFSDPVHGGNRGKAGWRMIGFPGALAMHRDHIETFRDRPFPNDPVGIADMS